MPLTTAKFHVTQHTKKRNHRSQYQFRGPGACVSSMKGRFQLEFPNTWNSRLSNLFWGRQRPCRAGRDTTGPGRCFKSSALVSAAFYPDVVEHSRTHVYFQTPKWQGWLRTSGEQIALRWSWCNGGKELVQGVGGWLGISNHFWASLHPQKTTSNSKRRRKKNHTHTHTHISRKNSKGKVEI